MIDRTLPLFRYAETRPVVAPSASEQSRELARCEGKLAKAVMDYLRVALSSTSREFHAANLCEWVGLRCGGSPESAMRVMRALRASGQVQVELLDRSRSHYRVLGVTG